MNRVTKSYLVTLALGVVCPAVIGAAAVPIIDRGAGLIGGIMIVGSFAVTAALVAREKGRTLWYALAGWIAPLLPIVLLLPYTKERRAQLMESEQGSCDGQK